MGAAGVEGRVEQKFDVIPAGVSSPLCMRLPSIENCRSSGCTYDNNDNDNDMILIMTMIVT